MLCVFDCESIPDTDLLRKVFGYKGSDKEVALEAIKEHEAKTQSSFLPIVFHKIVAISAVIADEYGVFERVSSMQASSEEGIVKDFLNFINSKNPKLVGFNSRNFDLPLLMIRALKYNISCPSYFDTNDNLNNKNKWENYRSRYSDRFHVDLMDQISEFGSVRGLKLDHLCLMAGIPGKFDISGDQVMDLHFEGEVEKIKEYCESDVLNTYWLYLKYEYLRGNLHKDDYILALNNMLLGVGKERSYSDIFSKSIKNELQK